MRIGLPSIDYLNIARMLAIGLAGAWAAVRIGLPMPYLLGSLGAVGLFVGLSSAAGRPIVELPKRPRDLFVGLIGVMIGASFTSDLTASLPAIWPSLLVLVGFVWAALGFGFVLFRIIGRYDPVTAVYSAMPGGLVESVTLGEEAGGDAKVLAMQHFARIIVVMTVVPGLYWYWSGHAVGSAAGESFETRAWTFLDVLELFIIAIVGIWLGPKLRLPASHLVCRLILSAALHGLDILHLSSPVWLLALAQLVVGVGLGTRFAGARGRDLTRAFSLSIFYVSGVLVMGYGVATMLTPLLPFDFDTLFVSFAPGGVTEMGLVALSLGISPVIVAAHHVFRIVVTVAVAAFLVRLFQRS